MLIKKSRHEINSMTTSHFGWLRPTAWYISSSFVYNQVNLYILR